MLILITFVNVSNTFTDQLPENFSQALQNEEERKRPKFEGSRDDKSSYYFKETETFNYEVKSRVCFFTLHRNSLLTVFYSIVSVNIQDIVYSRKMKTNLVAHQNRA